MKKNVLILGGSSDIGSELAKIFLDKNNYEVDLHFHSNIKALKNLRYKCNLIKSDLSIPNEKKILKKFRTNYDIIINLVGYISGKSFNDFTIKGLEKTLRINSLIPMMIIRRSLKTMIKKNGDVLLIHQV